jgi:hypothetical protein
MQFSANFAASAMRIATTEACLDLSKGCHLALPSNR